MALAWLFDVTADGVRRTEPAAPEELPAIVATPRRQRWPAGLFALVGIVALGTSAWLFMRASAGPSAEPVTGDVGSIAVLPFANLAGTEQTAPFVDGIHDDVLTQLSKIASLRVVSRTSVQEYRRTRKNIRDIAAELNVRHLVEGGVQRVGEQVRINVELIDACTDEHVWADTYNRTLTVANIIAIQTEIAEAIAGSFQTRLSRDARAVSAATKPTESLEAYDHYQRGAAYFRRTLVPADVQQAVAAFEVAVRIDPHFADAWAWLSYRTLHAVVGVREYARAASREGGRESR